MIAMKQRGWSLECSNCAQATPAKGLETVCPDCGAPWLVRYENSKPPKELKSEYAGRVWSMWRYREWLPLTTGEEPVTLGEGATPLLPVPQLGDALGMSRLFVKDESVNPTGSFKARGLSAAVTRALGDSAKRLVVPTAGNAGVALSAYGRRAGMEVQVFAPRSTPSRILEQISLFGANLELLDGHIGDCGKAAREYAERHNAFDVSTLREPYRIEGKKTLGLEIAEQMKWNLPDAVIYPTGGGTGLIGMWKCFQELRDAGWTSADFPRLYSVQSAGCAPVVRAFDTDSETVAPWENPETVAKGLRVPAPLGGAIILRAIRETGGSAVAVDDCSLSEAASRMAAATAVDASPEGGATLAALEKLLASGAIDRSENVVIFNTGAGWLYH
ncbi:MAG: threonine synthase [Gemmatimonadales bacterium]